MRRTCILATLLVALMFTPSIMATSGRAAPSCSELDLSDITSFVAVDPGACVIVDLGIRTHEQVLEIEIEVADDSMDVLLFDENGISPYENGQSYHSAFVEEASFESALGSIDFDWRPPTSINDKRWYYVVDNMAHDGDGGMGDQGGMTSRFSIDASQAQDSFWTDLHDVYLLSPDERINLLQFNLDAGTGVIIKADVLSGTGDFFIQTDNQLSGDLYLSGTNMDGVTGSSSLTWSVPSNYDKYSLNLMADASQSSSFHFTIEVSYDPPINPVISDYVNGSTIVGESITLDALDSPNTLNQINSLSWDFDGDGIEDSTGMVVSASWTTPGTKTVNLTASSLSGASMMASYQIVVEDVISPTAVISGEGARGLNGEWRLLRTADLILKATTSYDDHGIATSSWSVDGIPYSTATQITVSWPDIGTYSVGLTVTDHSGNIGSTNTTVVVYDETIPMLETSAIDAISEVNAGEKIEFRGAAVDYWDEPENLRYTWDLDLDEDSNGDGDPRNDPDVTGSTLTKTFTTTGEHQIAITVYDGSNNSDMYVFSVNVVEAPNQTGIFAIISIVFFVIIIVAGVVLFGHKGMQRKLALQMLFDKGLTAQEAEMRLLEIARTTKLSPFAKAAEMAGIEVGGEVKSAAQIQAEVRTEEMTLIYGSGAGTLEEDPNAGFGPTRTGSTVDQSFADEALAAFAEETPSKKIPVSLPQSSGQVKSGGIALPTKNKPAPTPAPVPTPTPSEPVQHTLRSDCSSCSKPFSMNMPLGVNSAVVACPSCGTDQLFER